MNNINNERESKRNYNVLGVNALMFIVLNYLLIKYPERQIILMLVIPVFLYGIMIRYNVIASVIIALLGVIPYLWGNNEKFIPLQLVPYFIAFLGTVPVRYFKKEINFNFISTFIAVLSGFVFRFYYMIYHFLNTNLGDFIEQLVEAVHNQISYYIFVNIGRLSQEQISVYKGFLIVLTEKTLSYFIIPYLLILSFICTYIILKGIKFISRMEKVEAPKIWDSEKIRISVYWMLILLIVSGAGKVFEKKNFILGSYFYTAAMAMLIFLGSVTVFSSSMYILGERFKIKSKLARIILSVPFILILSTNTMVIYTIVDSVMDLRRLNHNDSDKEIKDGQ